MITVQNYKDFEHGYILGFCDIVYYGLTIEGCRLMKGKNGRQPWVALPQNKIETNGQATRYEKFLHLSDANAKLSAITNLALKAKRGEGPPANHVSPEKENLSEYYSSQNSGNIDDLPC